MYKMYNPIYNQLIITNNHGHFTVSFLAIYWWFPTIFPGHMVRRLRTGCPEAGADDRTR